MARLTRTKLKAQQGKGVKRVKVDTAEKYLAAARQCGDRRMAGRIRRALDAQW